MFCFFFILRISRCRCYYIDEQGIYAKFNELMIIFILFFSFVLFYGKQKYYSFFVWVAKAKNSKTVAAPGNLQAHFTVTPFEPLFRGGVTFRLKLKTACHTLSDSIRIMNKAAAMFNHQIHPEFWML